jgi:DNA-binding MarR family transcriptional regulator
LDDTMTTTTRTSDIGVQLVRFMRNFKSLQAQMGHRARHGVDPSAYPVLVQLVESPKRTTELATCLHADTSTVSRQVTALVDVGFVERRADPEDRRATILVATEAGLAAYDQMRAGRERMLARILTDWTDAEVRQLVSVLSRFNDDFEVARPAVLADLTTDISEER